MNRYSFFVQSEDSGERLDSFLSVQLPECSRSRICSLISEGLVTVDDQLKTKSYKLRSGECVLIDIPEVKPLDVQPENIPLDIVYEDSDLLVVNKPQGMVVHPAPGSPDHTLVNALLFHCGSSLSGINGIQRPGIVHRIDRFTSGLLIVAKTDMAHRGLASQIAVHSFTRAYQGICFGTFTSLDGTIDRPIGRSRTDRKKMSVQEDGRPAITHYETVGVYRWHETTVSHMRFILETGRTHQIRVHASSAGHPLVGDSVYGFIRQDEKLFPELIGQCLHAYHIGFVHPVSGNFLEFDSELPEYFSQTLKKISL